MDETSALLPAPDDSAELERLREENARLKAAADSAAAAESRSRTTKRRSAAFAVLLVLGSTMIPVSVLTVWVRNQVLDTERYVATVAPLATDPAVRTALADRISTRVNEELAIEQLAREALPAEAGFLVAPIAAGAENLVREAAARVVESEQFAALWAEANRVAHGGVVVALTGAEGEVASVSDGKVVLQLGPMVQRVLDRVDARFGLDVSARVPAERLDVDFVIVDSEQLADVQVAVRWLDRLAWFSAVLAVGLLAAAVAVAADRRRGLLFVGVGVVVSMVLLRVGFAFGRDLYLTNLPDVVEHPDAALAIFDTLVRYVLQGTRVLFIIGLVMIVAAWLSGPSSIAMAVRGAWDRMLGRGSTVVGSSVELGPLPAFVARHRRHLQLAILTVAVLVLLTWEYPTGKVVILIALAALIPLAAVQALAAVADPEATPPGRRDHPSPVGTANGP
jgi:hypothetical protein